ncbi:hypothetical protein MBLNU457_1301t1 [Dothideomycetes sp. NU457]
MSEHSGLEIPFSVSHSHAPLRLLELPPELLDLLTTSPPTTLKLKSSSSDAGTAEAALCSPNRTYQLRQVQTSNSLYVVAPSSSAVNESNDQSGPGVTTFAQCNWTLEVLDAPSQSALPYMKQLIPLCTGPEINQILTKADLRTKAAIFSDVPLSDAECEQVWTDIVAFEDKARKSSFRPPPRILTKVWAAVSLAAVEKTIDLSKGLKVTDIEDLISALDEVPPELVEAMVKRLLPPEQQKLLIDAPLSDIDPTTTFTLDRSQTVRSVGTWLMEDLGETAEAELIRQWQNLLPEPWREDAQLSAIEGVYQRSTDGKVTSTSSSSQNGTSKTAAAPASTAAKRKWHEKFAKARKR